MATMTRRPELAPGYRYGKAIHPSDVVVGDVVMCAAPGISYGGPGEVLRVGPKNLVCKVGYFDMFLECKRPRAHVAYVCRGKVVHPVRHEKKIELPSKVV